MSAEITIRQARAGDADAVSTLLRATWHATYDDLIGPGEVAAISARWHDPKLLLEQMGAYEFLIAEHEDRIVGHAWARLRDDGSMELSRLYVLPEAQGRGTGQALFEAIRQRHPGRKMVLEVQEANVSAQNFYRRNGFVVTGRSAHCGSDSDVPSILMARHGD